MEGQRRISFKISGFGKGNSSLYDHFDTCFAIIEGNNSFIGRRALTRVRDVVFDAQEDFQRFINKRQKPDDDDLAMMGFHRSTLLGLGAWK